MAISNIKAVFQQDIQKVWETVTSLENYVGKSIVVTDSDFWK